MSQNTIFASRLNNVIFLRMTCHSPLHLSMGPKFHCTTLTMKPSLTQLFILNLNEYYVSVSVCQCNHFCFLNHIHINAYIHA